MARSALARIAFLWDFDFPCWRNFLPGFSLNTTPYETMLLVNYALDKACHHKRQYRFHTWNHFLDGWSKVICRAFHTGCDRTVYGQTGLFLLLANRNNLRGCFLFHHRYLLICHCLCFLNHHLTNPSLHKKKSIFKSVITHNECFISYVLKKYAISILVYDNNGSIPLHLLFL